MDIKYTKCFIGNEWKDSCDDTLFDVTNPATEEVICKVAECDKADVDVAVSLARKTFHRKSDWRRMPTRDKAAILRRLADLVADNKEELAKLETINNGKAIASSKSAVEFVIKVSNYIAGLGDCVEGNIKALDSDDFCFTIKDPIGVCGVILPWNYPLELFMMTVAPAIISGCTIVLKPAEATPLTALYLCELLKQAGLPSGVLNVLPGYGPTVGVAIAEHMDIDMVHFTGSTKVGRLIKEASAKSNLKRVLLEMGGKSPIIVCKDSDLDLAVKMSNIAVMENSGQVCVAGSRTYVHSSIYDEFVKKTVEMTKTLKVGEGINPETNLGPLINEVGMNKVLGYIKSGVEQGATIAFGGKRVGSKGWFVEPTIMTGVTDEMKICREEIFGPVQSILKFDDLDDAIDRANDTTYGLAAAVFTQNVTTGIQVSRLLEAGTVWVNTYFATPISLPFGGLKQSGEGLSNGMEGLNKFYTSRSIVFGMPKDM